MKPQLVAILLLLVCLPLGLLVWLGEERTRSEQERARASFETLLEDRLLEVEQGLARTVQKVRAKLDEVLLSDTFTPRGHTRLQPLIQNIVIGNSSRSGNTISYPIKGRMTAAEEAFVERIDLPATIKMLGYAKGERDETSKTSGWYTWYHGPGRHFLYWQRQAGGEIRACELNRMAFLSELIQELPADPLANGRIALLDESARPIYQWGDYDPGREARPVVEKSAPEPIESWRLAYYLPAERLGAPISQQDSFFKAVLYSVGGLILLLGSYFYWANTQALREASQRVSFVNQVSHELKTPLTNIRMYAELAESKLDPEDEDTQGCLDVVVAESGRLSRLIQNVLTFAKQQRGGMKLYPRSVSPDEVVRSVVESFRPALEEAGFTTEVNCGTPEMMNLDRDVLEQILSNLVSNVLKYADEGKYLGLANRCEDGRLLVDVVDHGDGIPSRWSRRVFAPFVRMSDRVNDGVAGTGIGLTIARELAEAHGGTLSLRSSPEGATFTVSLPEMS